MFSASSPPAVSAAAVSFTSALLVAVVFAGALAYLSCRWFGTVAEASVAVTWDGSVASEGAMGPDALSCGRTGPSSAACVPKPLSAGADSISSALTSQASSAWSCSRRTRRRACSSEHQVRATGRKLQAEKLIVSHVLEHRGHRAVQPAPQGNRPGDRYTPR